MSHDDTRDYTWTRTATTGTLSAAGRVRWGSDLITAPFTLERFVFGFIVRHQFSEGLPPAPPSSTSLRAQVLIVNSASGAPDIDVVTNPTADWLWVGLVQMTRLARAGYTGGGYDLGYWTPPEQLETRSRRKVTGTSTYRVYVVTTPLPTASGTPLPSWAFTAQLGALWSVPA